MRGSRKIAIKDRRLWKHAGILVIEAGFDAGRNEPITFDRSLIIYGRWNNNLTIWPRMAIGPWFELDFLIRLVTTLTGGHGKQILLLFLFF
jgi:hypothetical protein